MDVEGRTGGRGGLGPGHVRELAQQRRPHDREHAEARGLGRAGADAATEPGPVAPAAPTGSGHSGGSGGPGTLTRSPAAAPVAVTAGASASSHSTTTKRRRASSGSAVATAAPLPSAGELDQVRL